MPTCIPENPTFTTGAEREVWDLLRDQLGPDDVLLANVRLTNEDKDHEADLVVLMPDFGALVLEIKGGSVWYDQGWIQKGAADEAHWIAPVAQARDAKYAIRTYVENQAVWGSRTRIRWAHGVVTPYSVFGDDFSVPELPRWALHDKGDLAHLVTRLRANASQGDSQRAPDGDDVAAIADALTARFNTSYYDVNAEAAERAAEADRLTEQQMQILSVTRLINRVEVRGGAGSGKTVLALQQAKELTRGSAKHERPAQRVALICYSIGLATYLKRQVASWPRRQQPSFVGTFHEFGKQWEAPDGDRADSAFWEEELPRLMSELADDLPDGQRYDAVVVDEAQDFAESWWTPVLKALRDEERGGLYVFSDENQRIFGRFGVPPVALVPLVLDHCLRNTREIHEAFAPLAPSRMYARGGSGPEVRFVPSSAADAEEAADDEVVRLLDEEGWEPGRVALITTGHRHTSHRMQVESSTQEEYWETFWDAEEVFYGHVLGCKGLERAAVVLCLNEESVTDRARERLYVGMSRATDQLVVVGDPEWVRQVGGPSVARRLGI
ncbi:NERD domain-containing protein [Nocardioides sp. zg-536]|uniref:NERD domain-containing protein n=1 Tax=Nocardioides faecalis TaxID=2803858 RepID=A0A938Y3U6_9ACTN|nr:nuclease-related domain-containing DEAD/DEAH box helicase [Nocardioides faecalis]MBM9459498.1 NERD domain-containing protein [Nocardioides faecalis]QVI59402.1 NERD domain-containing protein [Nocardioides faecalis]